MQPTQKKLVSRAVLAAALASFCHGAASSEGEIPVTKEIQNIIDFLCHGAKTSKQAEANHTRMARGYTDRHPVLICLKNKIAELKAAGK